MADNAFGIWEGEVAVELPDRFDAHLYFIGRVRTPWTRRGECPKNARESDAVCTLEVDPRFAAALTGVETCSHLLVLYWMDRSPRNLVLQNPGRRGELRGTFALRSPARPNPIATERGAPRQGRRHQPVGGRPRLPRRNPAGRHQALFRVDQFGARRRGRDGTRRAGADGPPTAADAAETRRFCVKVDESLRITAS